MDTTKTIYFLDLLRRESSGYTEEINELYRKAIDGHDLVIELKRCLDEYVFYGEIGGSVKAEASALLDGMYRDPGSAIERLGKLRQQIVKIKNEADMCRRHLRSPEPFTDTISILNKKDIIPAKQALRQTAAVCTYMILLYGGADKIKDLGWTDNAGIHEYIYAVNTKFLPALMKYNSPKMSWVIEKKKLGGHALLDGEGFFLRFEDPRKVETLCSGIHKEPISTHSFLNIDAFRSGEPDVPYCWGTGNIVSVTPDKGLSMLETGIVTKLRSPTGAEYDKPLPTPFVCLKTLSGGNAFCISPDELNLALNRWQAGHEALYRRRHRQCMFCGRTMDSRERGLVCRSHFTSTL